MQKKKIMPALTALCLIMNLMFPIFKAYAAEKNEVTLNFTDGTITDGKAVYTNSGESSKGEIELVAKNDMDSYDSQAISENNMKIDLNEKDYYLKTASKISVENPDEILGAGSSDPYNALYIGDTRFDVTSNPYVKLDTTQFSGTLNIRLQKESAPSPTPSYPDNISIKATYDGFGMEVYLNTARIGAESNKIEGTGKGYASGEISNLISIQLAFGDGNIGSVTVNGEKINVPEGTKDRLEFSVAPASEYVIVVTKAKSSSSSDVPRTIIWDSDKNNNSSLKDDEILKNGSIEILDIKDKSGNSIGLDGVKQDTAKNNGWANILPGYKVILKLKPDYGYQLTSIKINGETLTAKEEESTFEYTMPDTNVHLSGIFEKVDDKVTTDTEKVKEGKIEIDESEVDSGSVVLSVSDAVLTEEQTAKFKEKAEGYEISAFLGIHLDRVLYKGTDSDVWSKELNDLKNEATVTLKLEEKINGNEIKIIHEKSDGTFEIIPADYNAAENTITFKTSSFSNYAIASKTENNIESKENNKEENNNNENIENTVIPKTGDNIMKYAIIFVLVALILAGFLAYNQKKKTKK